MKIPLHNLVIQMKIAQWECWVENPAPLPNFQESSSPVSDGKKSCLEAISHQGMNLCLKCKLACLGGKSESENNLGRKGPVDIIWCNPLELNGSSAL